VLKSEVLELELFYIDFSRFDVKRTKKKIIKMSIKLITREEI
jgi:hypothetical protein